MKIVVDLDGTLSRVNTFRAWTVRIFLMPNTIHRGRWLGAIVSFSAFYLLRTLRVLDHVHMKRLFLVLSGLMMRRQPDRRTVEQAVHAFADWVVDRRLNPRVLERIRAIQKEFGLTNRDVAMATAAPRLYAQFIADRFGFDCLATEFSLNDALADPFKAYIENVGVHKRQAVNTWREGSPFILLTDHVHDWPLIEQAEQVILVHPARDLMDRARRLGTLHEVLK